MDRLVRRISMATARATTRRGFMSDLARGLVAGGVGASFLFGGQRFAFADNCTTKNPGTCNGDCTQGIDGYGCYGYSVLCPLEGCNANGAGCNTDYGYNERYWWTCCCSGRVTRCATCIAPSGYDCECEGYTGGTC